MTRFSEAGERPLGTRGILQQQSEVMSGKRLNAEELICRWLTLRLDASDPIIWSWAGLHFPRSRTERMTRSGLIYNAIDLNVVEMKPSRHHHHRSTRTCCASISLWETRTSGNHSWCTAGTPEG